VNALAVVTVFVAFGVPSGPPQTPAGRALETSAIEVRLASAEGAARGQQAGRVGRPGQPDAQLTVQDVERMWDQFVLGQARAALELRDERQFRRFSVQLQNLQNLRRRLQRQRNTMQRDLGLMVEPGAVLDSAAVEARLAEFDEFNVRSAQQVRRAVAAVDGVLSLRQRVRFRVFDNRMAQRKLELLAQARANARNR